MNRITLWLNSRFPLLKTWKSYATNYQIPRNFNFFYYFGALALLILLNQMLTGLWLAFFYTPTAEGAFSSIEYIMRDVRLGWLIRMMHTTGASAMFIVLYLHLFRGLLYGSYQKPRELVWFLGMGLFLLFLGEAFMGYLLPWGQMSYWGAQVFTSLFGAVPFIGKSLMLWIRGDYLVSGVTLKRFYAMHIAGMPLLILFLVFLHIVALHQVGSNNPLGITLDKKKNPEAFIPMHPSHTIKEAWAAVVFLFIFFAVVFYAPQMGGFFLEPTNYIPANPLVTPDFIVPVWYMTPFYAMLRAIPYKLGGIITLQFSLLVLFMLPWLDKSPVRAMRFKGSYSRMAFWGMIAAFLVLGLLGNLEVGFWTLFLARLATALYFAYFILMPFYTRIETCKSLPQSLGEHA